MLCCKHEHPACSVIKWLVQCPPSGHLGEIHQSSRQLLSIRTAFKHGPSIPERKRYICGPVGFLRAMIPYQHTSTTALCTATWKFIKSASVPSVLWSPSTWRGTLFREQETPKHVFVLVGVEGALLNFQVGRKSKGSSSPPPSSVATPKANNWGDGAGPDQGALAIPSGSS